MIKSCASAVGVLSFDHMLSGEPLGSVGGGGRGRAYGIKLYDSHSTDPNEQCAGWGPADTGGVSTLTGAPRGRENDTAYTLTHPSRMCYD
eukprot:6121158-Prymnesium_polylepis.1